MRVAVAERLALDVADGVMLSDGELDEEDVTLWEGVLLGKAYDGDCEGVADIDGACERVCVDDGACEGVLDNVCVSEGVLLDVFEPVSVCDGLRLRVPLPVDVCVTVAVCDWLWVPERVTLIV